MKSIKCDKCGKIVGYSHSEHAKDSTEVFMFDSLNFIRAVRTLEEPVTCLCFPCYLVREG